MLSFVPSPEKQVLLERRCGIWTFPAQLSDLSANYCIRERAEATDARLVCTQRISADLIVNEIGSRTRGRRVQIAVATLAGAGRVSVVGQYVVDQTGIG